MAKCPAAATSDRNRSPISNLIQNKPLRKSIRPLGLKSDPYLAWINSEAYASAGAKVHFGQSLPGQTNSNFGRYRTETEVNLSISRSQTGLYQLMVQP